jgi:hypothetical protein
MYYGDMECALRYQAASQKVSASLTAVFASARSSGAIQGISIPTVIFYTSKSALGADPQQLHLGCPGFRTKL